MLIIAVHQDKIFANDFLEKGETVDLDRYIQLLIVSLKPYLQRNSVKPIILQDKASSHTSAMTTAYLWEMNWDLINHPPYSPDMNPRDYVFNKLKQPLRGIRLKNAE